jgi:hypothetical protein
MPANWPSHATMLPVKWPNHPPRMGAIKSTTTLFTLGAKAHAVHYRKIANNWTLHASDFPCASELHKFFKRSNRSRGSKLFETKKAPPRRLFPCITIMLPIT